MIVIKIQKNQTYYEFFPFLLKTIIPVCAQKKYLYNFKKTSYTNINE